MNFIHRHALCLSLRTHVLSDAKTLARRLTVISDQVFAALSEKVMPIARQDAETLLVELARCELEIFEAARAAAPARSEEAANHAAACESAVQDTLRRALALGDREVARNPLRNVATRLGVTLPEDDADWQALAHEATRVLLDVSVERERRHVGLYEGKTMFFRSAVNQADGASRALTVGAASVQVSTATVPARDLEMAPFAASAAPTGPDRPSGNAQPAAFGEVPPQQQPDHLPQEKPTPLEPRNSPEGSQVEVSPVAPRPISGSTPGAGTLLGSCARIPATPVEPEISEEMRREIRAAARPPRIQVETSLLSAESQAALRKVRGITLGEGFRLYIELKALGYEDNFSAPQKLCAEAGRKWAKSSAGNAEIAGRIWIDLLGDRPVDDIFWMEATDALSVIERLPTYHGKGGELVNTHGYLDLVERADDLAKAGAEAAKESLLEKGTPTAAELEQAEIDNLVPRIRADTFIRHGRMANRVGKMLFAMQLIDENPFSICAWTNREEKRLKALQDGPARTVWDDRINALFRSPVFQGQTAEPGDPLFWAPLIARFMGLRMEECLQLRPGDFGSQDDVPYVRIHNGDGNSLKSPAAQRNLPIHPALLELGLLRLVALRQKQGQPRLFPDLKRGQTKNSFSELFTKTFGYYRNANACYWKGLDFHALRTSFHGDLLNNDRSDAIRRRLMGHEPQDEGEKSYAQGLKMRALLERITCIDVDISMIVSPFADGQTPLSERAEELGLRVV